MKLSDYIIDHSKLEWEVMFGDWLWLVPDQFTDWIMNRFGDVFISLDDGIIHMLDVGGETFIKIAESRDDFAQKIDEGDNANRWLMIPLVDGLLEAGVTISDGQCDGYRILPVLSGDYRVQNTFVISITEHFSFHADLHQQNRDLPDGTEFVIKIKNL